MRPTKFLRSVVVSLCLCALALGQTAERVYGGLYQPAPAQPPSVRTWRLSERGKLLQDFPDVVKGSFIALHGATLVDECKMVLIQMEDGRRRALRFNMLDREDRQLALDTHRRITPSATDSASKRSYAAVWREYSKEKDTDVRTFETEHFLFFHGSGDGAEARRLQDEAAIRRMKGRAEEVWQFYEQGMHVEMPFARSETPRKIPVYLLETGLAKHLKGVASVHNGGILLHPSEVADDTNRFAHEFVHVIQGHHGSGAGGLWQGGLHEGHADWLSYQHNSSRGQKAILASARFTDYPLFSWQVSYGYWPLLQYFSETYSPSLGVDLLTKGKRDDGRASEAPLETIYRLGVERGYWRADPAWSAFADVLARAAAHKAYWDFIPQMSYLNLVRGAAESSGANEFRFSRKQPRRDGERWAPAADRAPGQFGYHAIELKPSAGGISASVEKQPDCDWRLIAVARDANWKCRYSDVVAAGQKLTFPVEAADQAWTLIVMAVPHRYRAHTEEDEKVNRFARYSFKLALDGAEPVVAAPPTPVAAVAQTTPSAAKAKAVTPVAAGAPKANAGAAVTLIERGTQTAWRYLDDGAQPPPTWTSGDFDDRNWKEGRAPLGYGENGLATQIGFGGKADAKQLAAYFRRSFDFAADGAPKKQLAVDMRIDDGAVVYLNGRELVRQNLPSGPLTVRTHAVSRVDGADETVYRRYLLPAAALQPGRNVLAVAVHQINAVSTDLFFDLQLSTTDEVPVVRATAAAREATLAYLKNNLVPAGMRIPDGYVDGGHAMKIAADGTVSSPREIIVVDRNRDTKLRQHLDYVRWLMRGNLPPAQRATLLAQYVDQQYSPVDGRSFSVEACELLLAAHAGREMLIGDIIRAGVCRHRSLVFKLLADEAGLSVALVRGHLGGQSYHTWNELTLADGEKRIVDVMNPMPGYYFPKTTERAADEYRTTQGKPYYAALATAARE